MTFGTKLLLLMREKHISQKELSEKTGISVSALSNYVNDKREPKISTFQILAEGLGVDIKELLEEE